MVFVNEAWNGTGEIVVYSNYHKYWLDRERKIKNPLFDKKPSAIKYFYNLLDCEICPGVTICVVPSSNAEKRESGIGKLGEMLAANGRDNKVYFLRRSHSINKLATGGSRNLSVHMQSIDTVEDIDISADIVLLMDDVTTTGNSLYVCKEILLNRGAANVEMFALGKAI